MSVSSPSHTTFTDTDKNNINKLKLEGLSTMYGQHVKIRQNTDKICYICNHTHIHTQNTDKILHLQSYTHILNIFVQTVKGVKDGNFLLNVALIVIKHSIQIIGINFISWRHIMITSVVEYKHFACHRGHCSIIFLCLVPNLQLSSFWFCISCVVGSA